MKGTIQDIVGQESGFIVENKSCVLDNWASNLSEYSVDLRRTVKVENCLTWLIRSGWVSFDEDDIQKNYLEYANPVTIEDLMVPGTLYDFGEFKLLAPDGWN